jgi:hypothetical protein
MPPLSGAGPDTEFPGSSGSGGVGLGGGEGVGGYVACRARGAKDSLVPAVMSPVNPPRTGKRRRDADT